MSPEQALVAQLAERLAQEHRDLGARVLAMIRAEITALDHDVRSRSLLEASVTENIVAALHFLQQGIAVEHLDAPTAALAYARMLAQRDVPLSALIRAYRIGHTMFLDTAFQSADTLAPPDRVQLVIALVRRSALYIDKICEQVGRTYELERDRWVSSRSGVRQQWVNELLAGGPVDLSQAERALRYPIDSIHVAYTLWPATEMTSFDVIAEVDDVRRHLVSASGARASLAVPTDEHETRLWLTLPQGTRRAGYELEPPRNCRLHASIGRPGGGLAGFRTTAYQAARVRDVIAARLAHDQATRSGSSASAPRWVHYDDVAAVALMATDMAALRDHVITTLGGLATSTARSEMLRETLHVFLTLNRSYAGAAQEMNLHRNSVQYRVQQAIDLLPNGATMLDDDFNVRAALVAAHWLAERVVDRS